jgi:outer membrane protein TolC
MVGFIVVVKPLLPVRSNLTIPPTNALVPFRKLEAIMSGLSVLSRFHAWTICLATAMAVSASGCRSKPEVAFDESADFQPFATQIEYPDACVELASATQDSELVPPLTLREPRPEEIWDLPLETAVMMGLQNSRVMREIGARVLSAPVGIATVYDPALQQTDPLVGEQAALSAFDANFATSLFLTQNDQSFNNPFFAGAGTTAGAASLTTENNQFLAEINKTAATGTNYAIRNQTIRTSRNSQFELFPSFYDTVFEAEFRHPLLQGSGLQFNRIAGPNARPGQYNGILIARVRTDIALADFERSVRDLVEDIQQTYWQLYFAYRNLDARVAARDAVLEQWRVANLEMEVQTGSRLEEALSREQYYRFQAQVADALSGVGTDTSTSQTGFGVFALERRLRLLMGIEINDGRLIRPADEPSRAEIVFDWENAVDQAMFRRVELRRQQWTIKQRELEVLAARNFLYSRLDLLGLYRRRGFGDDLFGERDQENGSAFRDLFDGQLEGWEVGLQFSTPIGNRIGHTAVRNAELALQRDRAVLQEQERYVLVELSEAFSELQRAYRQARNNFNRVVSARQRLELEQARYDVGQTQLQFVFDAQSQLADAEAEFYRSLVDYNLAIAKVHYSQGTLLDYAGVELSEGAWSNASYASAAKNARRFKRRHIDYCIMTPGPMSRGAYPQQTLSAEGGEVIPPGVDVPTSPQPAPTPAEPMPPAASPDDLDRLDLE